MQCCAQRKHDDDETEIIFDRSKRVKETLEDNEVEMDEGTPHLHTNSRLTHPLPTDVGYRANAILLQGTPISHLPTARLFAYAKHFDTTPLGLEWVNDQTCILVYPSNALARSAFASLQKPSPATEATTASNDANFTPDHDADGFVTAKPIPMTIWPPETRINSSLGVSEGLRGVLKMRWARFDDVKKKGAKHESEFYKKHGEDAGKELFNGRDPPPVKRARINHADGGGNSLVDVEMEKRRLDAELDSFLRESDSEGVTADGETGVDKSTSPPEVDVLPPSPPSKMRSDYIANDGRTLLDRFSDPTLFENDRNPAERTGLGLKDRLMMPLPRRRRDRDGEHGTRGARRRGGDHDVERERESSSGSLWDRLSPADADSDGGRKRRGGSGRRETRDARRGARRGDDRPRKTQQELDDELDAFLRQE